MQILNHLDKLWIFSAVAERGSISAAAKELALSQPAITRAIQTLEDAVGFKLFTRDRSGMRLTNGGNIFFETTLRLLREVTDSAERGAHAQNEMVGRLNIGTYESMAEYLWPDFLLLAKNTFPLLNLSLRTNSQGGHLRALRNGELDMLVDAEPRDHSGLTLWSLYTDRFSFYSCKKIEVSPETAQTLTLLSVHGVFDKENVTLEQHLARAGYRFQREYLFDSFTTVKRMAIKGLGVAILPQRLAGRNDGLQLLLAKGFKESFGPHGVYATISPHREGDRRIKALVHLLKKQLAPS